jgi:hypothetical protein
MKVRTYRLNARPTKPWLDSETGVRIGWTTSYGIGVDVAGVRTLAIEAENFDEVKDAAEALANRVDAPHVYVSVNVDGRKPAGFDRTFDKGLRFSKGGPAR